MGPGNKSAGTRNGSRSLGTMRSRRPGEVPVYEDWVEPKVYRQAVVDWIKFQDLAQKDSDNWLSYGQQVLTLLSNIRGSSRSRLGHITAMVQADMSLEDYTDIVDYILNTIDPLDKETAFLDTAKAWKELMSKSHGKKKTYDSYWTEYSNLCTQYEYSHGEVAQSPGVQELLALLCVLNANLDRTEFTWALQNAISYQKTVINQRDHSSAATKFKSFKEGPQSAAQAISQATKSCSADRSKDSVVEDSSPAGNGENPPNVDDEEMSREEILARFEIMTDDLTMRNEKAEKLLREISIVLDADDENAFPPATRDKVQSAQASMKANGKTIQKLISLQSKMDKIPVSKTVAAKVKGTISSEEPAIITMEAVRIALRRLDHGESASRARKGQGFAKNTIQPNKESTFSKTATKANSKKKVECHICKQNHYANQNPKCRKALEERRKAKQAEKQMDERTEFPLPEQDVVHSKRTTIEDGLDIIFSAMTQANNGIPSENEERCSLIVDGGAPGTVVGQANYVELCRDIGVQPQFELRRKNDCPMHAFGTPDNHSALQKIVGRCIFPLPVGNGEWIPIRAMMVDGNVPFTISKDQLSHYNVREYHKLQRISLNIGKRRVSLPTPVSRTDGHARIILSNTAMSINSADGFINDSEGRNTKEELQIMIARVHQRTHLRRTSLEMLFRRAGKW